MQLKTLIRSLAGIVVLSLCSVAQSPEPAVIVNRSNPVSSLSKSQLRKLLLGQQAKWPGGAEISILLPPSGQADRKSILQRYCGMSESEYSAWFLHASFKGEVLAVAKSMPSSQSIVQVVELVPGAIGIVSSTDVTSRVKLVNTGDSPE